MKVHPLTQSAHSGLTQYNTSYSQFQSYLTQSSQVKFVNTPKLSTRKPQKTPNRNRSPLQMRYNPQVSPIKSIDNDLNKLLYKMVSLEKQMKKEQRVTNANISYSPTIQLQLSKVMSPMKTRQFKQSKHIHKLQCKKVLKSQPIIQTSNKIRNNKSSHKSNINIRQFLIGKKLGEGKFGQVFVSLHKLTNSIYAIKKVFKSILDEYKLQNQLLNQVSIQSQLNHPNVIKLHTCFTDEYHIFMVTQFVPGKTLDKYLNSQQNLVSQIILQVIKALSYIHSKFIMHRDIKPQNIMYDNGIVKIGDFGWATTFKNRKSTTYCGTLDYVSPQVLQGKQYDCSVDLWSLGILTYELLSGKTPFKQSSKQKQMQCIKNCNRKRIEYPSSISPLAQNFISKLLVKQPSARMQLKDAQKHPFIVNHLRQFKIAKDLVKLI